MSLADEGMSLADEGMSLIVPMNINKRVKEYKDSVKLSQYQTEAVHGLILGDVHARRKTAGSNTTLDFQQSIIHSDYI